MFLQNLRAKLGARLNGEGESGFTLIELLVVMLILGILAAIALPAFFNQRDKANDAEAKEYAHSAQVAMETYATDNGGSYVGATVLLLEEIEPTLANADLEVPAEALAQDEYELISESSNGTDFRVINEGGNFSFTCAPEGGGCPPGGNWGE